MFLDMVLMLLTFSQAHNSKSFGLDLDTNHLAALPFARFDADGCLAVRVAMLAYAGEIRTDGS